mmetsp:Transcript_33867/g.54948  ORF Transcript_33867/g.54948 Transcript_33867/m.54948 type:complete len:84 (-) Transcript_33867:305-556(-)
MNALTVKAVHCGTSSSSVHFENGSFEDMPQPGFTFFGIGPCLVARCKFCLCPFPSLQAMVVTKKDSSMSNLLVYQDVLVFFRT